MKKSKEQQLIDACKRGDVEVVKQFIEEGEVDVNCKDEDGWPCLMSACWEQHTDLIKELFKHPKIDVNIKNKFGWSCLMWACYLDCDETVIEFLKRPEINLEFKNINENNAYYLSSKEIKFLLKAKKLQQTIYNSNK